MKRLIQWSIDHHWMVLALSVLLAAAGVWTARAMPVDVFPDLTAPTVTILTEGRGMAPEEMETLVTFPDRSRHQRRVGRPARALGDGRRHRGRLGRVRLGHRHLSARARSSPRSCRSSSGSLPPQVERPDSRAHLVDHGRDPLLRDLVRCRRSARAANRRRYRRAPPAARACRACRR